MEASLQKEGNPAETTQETEKLYKDPAVFNHSTWQEPEQGKSEFQASTEERIKSLQATANTNVETILNNIPERPEEPTKEIELEKYLEALPDQIEEFTHETETDPMVEVTQPAPYREPAEGVEKETEINEGDLFNFDREVEPILDVLVGTVMEQSLAEYADEEEIRVIREARTRAKQRRAEELEEVRRLEEAEKRKREEIVKREAEDMRRREIEETLTKKIEAQLFARQYCKKLEQDVLDQLEQKGAFSSRLENAVTGEFIPNIINLGIEKAKKRDKIHDILTAMVKEAVKRGIEMEKGKK